MALISKVWHIGETLFPHKIQMPKMLCTPDDKKVMQQIQAAHSPDANQNVDENALLAKAEDILHHATPTTHLDTKLDSQILADKPHQHGISDALAFTIHKIGCELSCNCSGEGDMKPITQAVFNTVKKYSWEDKVVIALSAFAVNYGEFCLLLQVHASNSLAKNVVQLKPLPDISEREPLISALLKVVIDVAKCIIDLMDLPSQYISPDEHPLSEALTRIPYAVYWAIKGIVACSSQSIGLMNMSHEYVTSNAEARKKLTDLAQILKSIHAHLANHLALCREHIGERKGLFLD